MRIDDVPTADLLATILELTGLDPKQSALAEGRSLVSLLGEPAGMLDDEELVRERLRGLGYIA